MPSESQMYADKDRRDREEERRRNQEWADKEAKWAQAEANEAAKDKIYADRLNFTQDLLEKKKIYDYNGPADVWGTERTPNTLLHYLIKYMPVKLEDIFNNFIPYQFTYADFKQIKNETNLISDDDWKAFNEAITKKNGCKKNLLRKTNLNCKKNFENTYVNEPELYSGGSRKIKKSKNLKKHLHKIRRSKNKSF
jgi:hypothetical protein